MKYIDADLLRKEIESLKSLEYPCDNSEQNFGFEYALDRLSDSLDSLQQEQDLIVINKKTWEAQEQFRKNKVFGKPLQQEQPIDVISPFSGGKVTLCAKEEELTYRGEKVTIQRQFYRCEDTGEEFTDAKLDNDMMWAVFRAYCEKKGFESFEDILPNEQPCDTCTNDKGCVTCKDGELWEGKEQH